MVSNPSDPFIVSLYHQVIGDLEELDNAAQSQGTTQRRADEDGASHHLRKRKKQFGREFRRKKKKKVPVTGEHTEKSTHFVDLVALTQTHVTLLASTPVLPAVCSAQFAQGSSCVLVASGCRRVGPAGGSSAGGGGGRGSAVALQDKRHPRRDNWTGN